MLEFAQWRQQSVDTREWRSHKEWKENVGQLTGHSGDADGESRSRR